MQIQTTSTVTRDSDKFQLRLPDGMRQKISDQARINGRSINAEMVDRLRTSFDFSNSPEKTLLARQNGMIAFLCECIEQLVVVVPADELGMQKIDTILALYRSMHSNEKLDFNGVE